MSTVEAISLANAVRRIFLLRVEESAEFSFYLRVATDD